MGDLWGRVWAVDIGTAGLTGKRLEGLRTTFDVRLGGGGRSQPASVSLTNAAPQTLGMLERPDTVVRILAGYVDGGAVQLAQGTVIPGSIETTRQGPDLVTAWQIKDAALGLESVTLSRSWGRVTAPEVVDYIRQALGLAVGSVSYARPVTYTRGFTLWGPAQRYLQTLAQDTGCRWTIKDGRLYFYPLDGGARETADVWSGATGMIEEPGPADKGQVRARALLRPGLRPGDAIRLDSTRYQGFYVADEVQHEGDSDGDAWYTTAILRGRL